MTIPSNPREEALIRQLLESWASATRRNDKDNILKNHAPDVLIYDVLPPMKYESALSYRRGWDDWQPETQGEFRFDFEDLVIAAGSEVAFAHGFIQCAGTLARGERFEDLVRATFCLGKAQGTWKIYHQHISKPVSPGR